MANNLFNAIEASYQSLLAAMSAAEACSSQGNTFETKGAVRRVKDALSGLGRYFFQLKEDFKLNVFIKDAEKIPSTGLNEKLTRVWQYIHAPDTFLAEAYLVSAETALRNSEMFSVANSYSHIKPGEKLRCFLDAQDNLKERADTLDKLLAILQNQRLCQP